MDIPACDRTKGHCGCMSVNVTGCVCVFRTFPCLGTLGEALSSVKTLSCCCYLTAACSTCRASPPTLSWVGFPPLPSGRKRVQTCVTTPLYQLQVILPYWPLYYAEYDHFISSTAGFRVRFSRYQQAVAADFCHAQCTPSASLFLKGNCDDFKSV